MATNTFTIKFVVKHEKMDKKGEVPVYAKLFINGKKLELTTNRKVLPENWAENQSVNDPSLNTYLELFKAKLYDAYSKLTLSHEYLTPELFKEVLAGKKPKEEKKHFLIQTTEQHNKNFESLIGVKYSYGSYKNYKTTLKYLKEFIPLIYKQKDIELNKVNFNFCEQFYSFLTTEKTCTTNGANKQIQRLKKIINYSIKQGYINFNPMATFTLEFKPVTKIALTQDEVNRLAKMTFSRKTLENVRNAFLFQCYTGLSYADVKRLAKKHLHTDDKGNLWIKMERAKTTTYFSVPLLPKALEILEQYKELKQKGDLLLPVLSNHKMNSHLKLIQELAKINKNLTTHLARHTFATTITLGNGVPIETVSRMLGHTKLSTTQVYARVLDNKIANDMEVLKGKLK